MKPLVLFTLAILVLLVQSGQIGSDLPGLAHAQSGGGYDLTWSTIDGGGGESTGGGFSLTGTAGQSDAGLLSGGGYTLNGGFWTSAAPSYKSFLPLVLRF